MSKSKITSFSPLPEAIVKRYECWLLHDKIPVFKDGQIKYICPTCSNKKD